MIRICLKCNAYYADDSLAFCLVDGTPLFNLDPSSDHWSEGVRVIEDKKNALRKQKRRIKWRRVLMTVTTTAIVTMVVYVVVANSIIYLKPKQEESVPTNPLKPATTPTQPSVLPTPTPSPSTSPTPECSEADKMREMKTIKAKYGDVWQQSAKADPPKVSNEPTPPRAVKPEVSLRPLDIRNTIKTCTSASVSITYEWEVRTTFNGKPKVQTVEKKRQFNYVKIGGLWRPG